MSYTAKYDGRIYLYTNKNKALYHQLRRNSKFEIFCIEKPRWMRIRGRLVSDDRQEVRKELFNQNTSFDDMRPPMSYLADENDGTLVPLYMQDCSAVLFDYLEQKEIIFF